jgi:hypothetical protein
MKGPLRSNRVRLLGRKAQEDVDVGDALRARPWKARVNPSRNELDELSNSLRDIENSKNIGARNLPIHLPVRCRAIPILSIKQK